MIDELASRADAAAGLLKERGQTIAIADGSTGGLISAGFVALPGATTFYLGGGVVYSLAGRDLLLGLERAELKGLRSVTEGYALVQARAIRDRFGADWGLAETGSAGPSHPFGIEAGRSCIAVVGPGVAIARTIETGDTSRTANMQAFAFAALDLLADALFEIGQSGGR